MRIQRLTKDAKENLLEDLLKRSPNNYGQYEQGVQEILAHVKEEKDQAIFMKNRDSTAGSTANRTEQSWDRKSHHFTESVYMCRAEKRYIHLLY